MLQQHEGLAYLPLTGSSFCASSRGLEATALPGFAQSEPFWGCCDASRIGIEGGASGNARGEVGSKTELCVEVKQLAKHGGGSTSSTAWGRA